MIVVNVKENESIEKALKRFKKKFERTGVLREVRGRAYYTKPSVTRRHEVLRAAYRQKMQSQEENA
ncbi:MAG: 30S ribosomal protein S21 [Bacteroidota bacterium]